MIKFHFFFLDLNKEDLIETLLNIYCRSILLMPNSVVDGGNENESSSPSSSSYLIIIEPEYNLADIIRQLMDTSFVIYNSCPNN